MMPWEHALVGYIAYSVFRHTVYGGSPTSGETLAVVFASLLPDLIDKPLAWEFGVFASGYAIGHSILFALPLVITTGWLTAARGRAALGRAFAVGYLLHLPGDLLPEYLHSGEVPLDSILWPVRRGGDGYERGFVGEFTGNFVGYGRWISEQVASGEPTPYLVGMLAIAGIGFVLWVYDGMPVGRETASGVRRAARMAVRAVGK